jgi:SAM-dependent methyltransferase
LKSGLQTVRVSCAQCGSDRSRPVAEGTDREFTTTTDVFTVVQCTDCGLLYLNPRPDTSELDTIYPPTYQSYNIRAEDDGVDRRSWVTRLRHRLYSRRFQHPLRHLADRQTIDLLDVGCGDGWQLDLYRLAGRTRVRTSGVEIKEDVCEVARRKGHRVYCGRFEDVQISDRFDLVNLSQVIEHVADPRGFVKRIHGVLRPGGVFVLETPNTDTWDWKWFRAGAWGAYHIPRHWTFFDPAALRHIVEPVGFRLLGISFHPAPVHWVWTLHNLAWAHGGIVGRVGRRVFAPMDVFGGGFKTLALLSAFTAVDMGLLALTRRTSSMMAVFRRDGS